MIKIEAIVRQERMSDVANALDDAGVKGYSYWNITGRGHQAGVDVFTGRGGHVTHINVLPKTMVMTVIPDSMRDAVIDAIVNAAKTGAEGIIGDGKIFVSSVDDAVRVRTGETGESVIM